jgi:hypothetical protein
MFNTGNSPLMVLGILISLGFIFLSVWSVNKLFVNRTQDVLVRFILMVFAALVAVFIVDKTVAFQVSLLSEQQNAQLFELIKTLTLMIFSYYFGTQNGEQKK